MGSPAAHRLWWDASGSVRSCWLGHVLLHAGAQGCDRLRCRARIVASRCADVTRERQVPHAREKEG